MVIDKTTFPRYTRNSDTVAWKVYVRSILPQIHQQFFLQLILREITILLPKYPYTTLCRLLTFMRVIFIAL